MAASASLQSMLVETRARYPLTMSQKRVAAATVKVSLSASA